MEWPRHGQSDLTGDIGVALVARTVAQELKWIFRPKPAHDVGIDGEIEIRDADGTVHGRLIAVQIKTGASALRSRDGSGYRFRPKSRHLHYWLAHSLPVALILCDETSDVAGGSTSRRQVCRMASSSFHTFRGSTPMRSMRSARGLRVSRRLTLCCPSSRSGWRKTASSISDGHATSSTHATGTVCRCCVTCQRGSPVRSSCWTLAQDSMLSTFNLSMTARSTTPRSAA